MHGQVGIHFHVSAGVSIGNWEYIEFIMEDILAKQLCNNIVKTHPSTVVILDDIVKSHGRGILIKLAQRLML